MNFFLKSKILISIWLLFFVILMSLFILIPYITEKNIIDLVIQNNKQMVNQIKLTRSYYVQYIVKDIENNYDITFDSQHKNDNKKLPLPATMIHELGEIFSKEGDYKYKTYSNFPFKNRLNRVLSKNDKKTLEEIKKSNGVYVSRAYIKNKPILKVAIADYMSEVSCVKCHNNHIDKTWENDKWSLGDIRGVIEITTFLDKPFGQIIKMRNDILFVVGVLFILFILYYSYKLVKREDELLEMADLLDKKVQIEIVKNKEKEQLLLQKTKLSSMGEMINAIAHQWRQPISELSSILINIDLKYRLNKINAQFMNTKIKKAENILEYMSETIEDFRSFFKKDKKKSTFNVCNMINNCINISNISSDTNNIKVIKNINSDISIYTLQNELSQVILSLLTNSKEALHFNNIQKAFIRIDVQYYKNDIMISIEDNAKGINKKNIKKIFNSSFTTKEQGSGMGLYISRLIVEKNLNGRLSVTNSKYGAKFIIYL